MDVQQKPLPLPLKELLRRIEARTEKTASCWLWKAHTQVSNGNGPVTSVYVDGKTIVIKARRIIWISYFGEVLCWHKILTTCGVMNCIAPDHLKMETPSAWQKKLYRTGRHSRNAGKHWLRYSDDVIRQIVDDFFVNNCSIKDIAKNVHMPKGSVSAILRGHTRASVTGISRRPAGELQVLRPMQRVGHKLTGQDVIQIIDLIKSGAILKTIAMQFGVSPSSISKIKHNRQWIRRTRILDQQELLHNGMTVPVFDATSEPHPDEALVWQHWKGGKSA